MSTYVVGDVHGCANSLYALLAQTEIDLERDALWMVGDLVNRGPRSLEVLRWAKECHEKMGQRFVTVLGNHDLHLLAIGAGVTTGGRLDTVEELLAAPDREPLLEWLRRRPFLHQEGDTLLVHAGLLPGWSVEAAIEAARRAEKYLRGPKAAKVLKRKSPRGSQDSVHTAIYAFTRLRTCTAEGDPCRYSGSPRGAPPGCRPWFEVEGRWRHSGLSVVFGHWAALGLHVDQEVVGLDSGCVWGGGLTAVRLEDRRFFHQPTREPATELPR